MTRKLLLELARKHGTPLVVVDRDLLRRAYASFRRHLPKVQAYYAVKANPAPEILRTLYQAVASFDVASLAEFLLVQTRVEHVQDKGREDFMWEKTICASRIKRGETLMPLNQYKPLLT